MYLTYVSKADEAEAVARNIVAAGGKACAFRLDVADAEAVAAFFKERIKDQVELDVLVNNASTISAPHPFLEHTINDLEEALHSGLYGTWQMMQLCFPYMKEHGGSIINFGSIGGVNGLEGFAAYAAEKEAIRGLSRVVAREWGQFGIRVNCVCPNVITDRFEEGIHQSPKEIQEYLIGNMSQNAMHRPGKAYEDFTPAALFLASEDSRWVTGQTSMWRAAPGSPPESASSTRKHRQGSGHRKSPLRAKARRGFLGRSKSKRIQGITYRLLDFLQMPIFSAEAISSSRNWG